VNYKPPLLPPTKYQERIEEITKKNKPTFENIIELQADMCKMQMFNDCNKRTSIVFCNAILIQNNLGCIKINDQAKWIDKLLDYYQDNKNLKAFVDFVKNESM
jgi:prophage maintenance system killer protein